MATVQCTTLAIYSPNEKNPEITAIKRSFFTVQEIDGEETPIELRFFMNVLTKNIAKHEALLASGELTPMTLEKYNFKTTTGTFTAKDGSTQTGDTTWCTPRI
jgi:hypothetical protein